METNTKELKFTIHGDKNGSLVALEELKDVPFDIRRVYYMFGTDANAVRGKHAHKNLEQVIICLRGSCILTADDGSKVSKHILDSPDRGIFLSNLIWREITDFTEDAVILVLASEPYDENDYIRNYDEFIEMTKHAYRNNAQ